MATVADPCSAPAVEAFDDVLAKVRASTSPRRSPGSVPVSSWLIHAGVLALWVALLAAPLLLSGVWAWSIGLVYAAYDTALLTFTFWHTLPLRSAKSKPDLGVGAGPLPTIGVLVASKDEACVIPRTLDALLGQSDPPEVIMVVDDGSTDATADLMGGHYGLRRPGLGEVSTGPTRVQWLRLAGGGKSRALNAALPLIRTDVIITVDADTVVRPGAIGAMRDAFAREPELVAATGVLVPVCAPTTEGRVFELFQTYEYVRNFLSRYAWMHVGGLLLISGAFAAMRRTAVLEVGGFDTDCLVEDYELVHRLKRHGALHDRGWTTRVVGEALALTEAPSSLGSFLSQRRRWFGGFLQTQYWYREMVGSSRYGATGLAMLPVKAVDTLQPLYGLTALALLLSYAVRGRLSVLAPILIVIAAKVVIDMSFQMWAIHLHRRWVGRIAAPSYAQALLASLVEPFTFQILRHVGAVWGWAAFVTGRQTWGRQKRSRER